MTNKPTQAQIKQAMGLLKTLPIQETQGHRFYKPECLNVGLVALESKQKFFNPLKIGVN